MITSTERHPFITFEGPIAAGKTTLACMLAGHLDCELLREDFEGNEFLADFYADENRWSLAMQLWFLSSRRKQLNGVVDQLSGTVVADYSYLKDGIFASVLLRGRELRLYNQLAASLHYSLRVPDLVVYLDAANNVLLDRIRRRQRPYEAAINDRYLNTLRIAYERELFVSCNLRVLRQDTSELDLDSKDQMTAFYMKIVAAAAPQPKVSTLVRGTRS